MKINRPRFSNKCNLCLKCIYGCPQKALILGIGKFLIIKQGYNFEELRMKTPTSKDIDNLANGYIWSGVKKYLLEQ